MLTSSQISTTELRCYDHEMYGQVKLADVSISAEDLEVELRMLGVVRPSDPWNCQLLCPINSLHKYLGATFVFWQTLLQQCSSLSLYSSARAFSKIASELGSSRYRYGEARM